MNTAQKYSITAADHAHYEGIVELFTSPEELFLIYPSGTWPFDKMQLKGLSKKRSDFTVALDGDRVIGFASIYTHLSRDKYFIGNVVIAISHRGRGIGSALICHMCDLVFNRYAPRVNISVFSFNTSALLLYTSLGFKPFDIEKRTMPNGSSTALLHMHLDAQSR
jgi:ribosomal protein S18 acetylase RimI-like enzyme